MSNSELLELINEFIEYTKENDIWFDLDGPLMMTIVTKEDTFRQKSVLGMPFIPVSAREGATGVIVVFEPEEAQSFKYIENKFGTIDGAFPTFFEEALKWVEKDIGLAKALSEDEEFELDSENSPDLFNAVIKARKLLEVREVEEMFDDVSGISELGIYG